MSGHEKIVCSCGAVIAQCRCMHQKVVRVVAKGCKARRERIEEGLIEVARLMDET